LDFESNGLLDSSDKSPAATKIWVMGYWDFSFGKEIKYTTDTNEMMSIIDSYDVVFVHNGFLFDTLLTEKLLGYSFNSKIFDTLSLSYYLYPARLKHGLKEWECSLLFYISFCESLLLASLLFASLLFASLLFASLSSFCVLYCIRYLSF